MRYFQITLILSLSIALFGTGLYAQPVPVHEDRFIQIGGIDQWVSLRGEDRSKPLVLFLHGGPGSVLSPYSEVLFGSWEKDFVLAQWDQRGAGRTYGKNAPAQAGEEYWLENPLKLEQMTADGIELTRYLLDHLGQKKLILLGTSWGSILGTRMALAAPELFHAYIGHAQFVGLGKNLETAYQEVLSRSGKAEDTTAMHSLTSLGKPPYKSARDMGLFLRIIKAYEGAASVPAPANWRQPAQEYDNERDIADRYQGDDYSFLYFAGHEKLGIKPMAESIDLIAETPVFHSPVYLVQGEEDILTAGALNTLFFEKLRAPHKEYFLVSGAGHGFNEAVLDQLFDVLMGLELP